MSRGARLTLLCLTTFLVLFPLAVEKPGLPISLKADEPAYYLMALSLAHDGDLVCDLGDINRLSQEFPYLPVRNLILMTDDNWQTTYFGKPYIYSLLAAPAAGLFGANGMVAVNLALLMAMVWMGASYLERFNTGMVAVLYSIGFFFLSTSFAYAFWLHPEMFNMASVMASLFLAFKYWERPESNPERPAGRWSARIAAAAPVLSGAVLALGVYNKPVLAAFGLIPLYMLARRGRNRDLLAWLLGAIVSMAVIASISALLTGHPSAYLGVQRSGVSVEDVDKMPVEPREVAVDALPDTSNSWYWIFRVPDLELATVGRDVGYFLWGRHTGLIPYMPFAVLSLLLFLLNSPRSRERWATLGSLALVAVFFLLWIPFNWHGGGGFVGNRYFINAYPAFLFLVTRVRPSAILVGGYGIGALLLGTISLTPLGRPVQYPTLQAHVRSPVFRLFPLELSKLQRIPGYHGIRQPGAFFMGRRDVVQKHQGEIWTHGGLDVEIWMQTTDPVERAFFQVRSLAPNNDVDLWLGDSHAYARFRPGDSSRVQIVELQPHGSSWVHQKSRKETLHHYRMRVRSSHGRRPPLSLGHPLAVFPVGVALRYLGSEDPRASDVFAAEFSATELPPTVVAGERFKVNTSLANRSTKSWPSSGAIKVQVAYHWLDTEGETVLWDGIRTRLPQDVAPGQTEELQLEVEAPPDPGRYVLVLDPVYEHVSWFSARHADSALRREVEVLAADETRAATDGESADGS